MVMVAVSVGRGVWVGRGVSVGSGVALGALVFVATGDGKAVAVGLGDMTLQPVNIMNRKVKIAMRWDAIV
jgi:hypothetical protein